MIQGIRIIGQLTYDTYRQSRSSGIFWIMLVVTAVTVFVCSSISVRGAMEPLATAGGDTEMLPGHETHSVDPVSMRQSGVQRIQGELVFGFGAFSVPLPRGGTDAVLLLKQLLAGLVADTLGLLLALIWTSGFLPAFLQPNAVTVLLGKPTPRWLLLVGKFIGVLVFVLFQVTVFVFSTWLVLGLRTGEWSTHYFWCIPILLLHFGIFFTGSILLAVVSRSTSVCVFGSMFYWLICWSINYNRHSMMLLEKDAPSALGTPVTKFLVEATYWILPKPVDMQLILFEAMEGSSHFAGVLDVEKLRQLDAFHPVLSVAASLVFSLYMLYSAILYFRHADY